MAGRPKPCGREAGARLVVGRHARTDPGLHPPLACNGLRLPRLGLQHDSWFYKLTWWVREMRKTAEDEEEARASSLTSSYRRRQGSIATPQRTHR